MSNQKKTPARLTFSEQDVCCRGEFSALDRIETSVLVRDALAFVSAAELPESAATHSSRAPTTSRKR